VATECWAALDDRIFSEAYVIISAVAGVSVEKVKMLVALWGGLCIL
jgi:hypothetical protein